MEWEPKVNRWMGAEIQAVLKGAAMLDGEWKAVEGATAAEKAARRGRLAPPCGSSRWWWRCRRGYGSPGGLAPPLSGWRRSQLPSSYPFAEERVLEKVFSVELIDYLVGYEALERLGDTADIPYPVGLHELAGKHLGMVGLGNPL